MKRSKLPLTAAASLLTLCALGCQADDTPLANATIFSTPESSIFPMPREPRSFANKADVER